jgi:hypothetical protein
MFWNIKLSHIMIGLLGIFAPGRSITAGVVDQFFVPISKRIQ